MAKHVLTDVLVSVNGTDLSNHVQSVTYESGIEGVPANSMTDTQKYEMPGLITITDPQITYFQDYAASQVYVTHQALITNRSTFTLIVKPTSAADSATNPTFTCSAFVKKHPFVNGAHGAAYMAQVTYDVAGALTIDVT